MKKRLASLALALAVAGSIGFGTQAAFAKSGAEAAPKSDSKVVSTEEETPKPRDPNWYCENWPGSKDAKHDQKWYDSHCKTTKPTHDNDWYCKNWPKSKDAKHDQDWYYRHCYRTPPKTMTPTFTG